MTNDVTALFAMTCVLIAGHILVVGLVRHVWNIPRFLRDASEGGSVGVLLTLMQEGLAGNSVL